MQLDKKEKINRQEKFALDNFVGVEDIGKQLLKILNSKKKFVEDLKKKKEKNEIDDDAYYDEFYEYDEQIKNSLSPLIAVLIIKLSNTFSHAVSGNSTRPLWMIINFMDQYGISSNILNKDFVNLSNSRRFNNSYLLDIFAISAAKIDDIRFIKHLEKFGKKNKERKNIYQYLSTSFRNIGDMDTFGMQNFSDKKRIAFESLINGSRQVYDYFTDSKGLPIEYIMKYIDKNNNSHTKLDQKETKNVLDIHPELFNIILENMPQNIPQEIIDIFMY